MLLGLTPLYGISLQIQNDLSQFNLMIEMFPSQLLFQQEQNILKLHMKQNWTADKAAAMTVI